MQLVNKNKKKKKEKGKKERKRRKGGARGAREFKREKNAKADLYRSFGQYLFHRVVSKRGVV